MSPTVINVAVVLCLALAFAAALPADNNNATLPTSADIGSARQGRADLSSLARLLTPNNLAQVKSLFSGLGAYGSSGLSNVLSFNVSNLIIITLLAGLAILIAPAVLSLFGLGTAATTFGRSLGLGANGQLANTEHVYRALDGFFRDYNIDAKTCMQRFACTASRSSTLAIRQGNPSYVDSALNYLMNSTYVTSFLDSTSMMDAVNFGRDGGDCEIEYGKCPFSWAKVTQYIPFLGSASSTAAPQTPPTPPPKSLFNLPVRTAK